MEGRGKINEGTRKRDSLLVFYVNICGRRVGDFLKCSRRKNHGGIRPRRLRNRSQCPINNFYLNGRALNAGSSDCRAYAPHQILSPAGSTIIPYPLAGRPEQVTWRELVRISSITGCGCMNKNRERNLAKNKRKATRYICLKVFELQLAKVIFLS